MAASVVEAVLRRRLPVRRGNLELGLDGRVTTGQDGALRAPLCLADLHSGGLMTQQVRLTPPGTGESMRTTAYVEAWIDQLPQLLTRSGGQLIPPAEVVYRWALTETAASSRNDFCGVLADTARLGAWDHDRDRADLVDDAAVVGLEQFADALHVAELPTIELNPAFGSVGSVRLGGGALLPAGRAWPVANGRPMLHLAHIDLEAVELTGTALPRTGSLIIFGDPETECAEAIVEPDSSQLVPVAPRPGHPLLSERRYTTWGVTPLYPALNDDFYRRVTGDKDTAARLADFAGKYRRADVLGLRSRLLGHPSPLQDDPAYRLATGDVPVDQWRLLLQFDPNHTDDRRFGDGGVFYVMVPEADLRSGTLTTVRGVFQTY